MTSTNVFMGSISEKPSSRVLKPPGGGNSNIFGDVGPTKPANPPAKTENNIVPQATETTKQSDNKVVLEKAEPVKPSVQETANASKNTAQQKASSFKQKLQASYNPITGESYGNENSTQARSTTAVKQPPGGVSTKLW